MLLSYAEILNSAANGRNITTSVIVPSTIDTSSNRKAMPDANTDNWVTTQQIAEILEMVLSPVGNPLRETVLKVYNNS